MFNKCRSADAGFCFKFQSNFGKPGRKEIKKNRKYWFGHLIDYCKFSNLDASYGKNFQSARKDRPANKKDP